MTNGQKHNHALLVKFIEGTYLQAIYSTYLTLYRYQYQESGKTDHAHVGFHVRFEYTFFLPS